MIDQRLSLVDQVVTGASSVLAALDQLQPVIVVSPAASPAARASAVALLAMIGRLHPAAQLKGSGSVGANPWGVQDLQWARTRISAAFPPVTVPPERIVTIGYGADVDADLWVGGGDWNVELSSRPAVLENCSFGLGLHAGASFAAAEIFRQAIAPLGAVQRTGCEVAWNLLDFNLAHVAAPEHSAPSPPSLLVLGGGSVGSSTVGALICAGLDAGTAIVVDPDSLDPEKNPFRYPACLGAEAAQKSQWLVDLLGRAGWSAKGHSMSIRDWVMQAPRPGWNGIALSSVDTVDGRLDAADVLAQTTLSAAVDGLTLHVQREHLGDGLRCPFCDFVDLGGEVSRAGVIGQHVGLSEQRILELAGNDQLAEADIALSVAAGKLAPEVSSHFIGRRLADLVNRLYAETRVTLPALGQAVTVSAPFVSWMTGTLAAAEILKDAVSLPMVDRRVEVDMAGGPQGYVHRRSADATGRCICGPGRVRARWMSRLYETRNN